MENRNILEAIHAVYTKIGYVQKEGQVAFGNTKYKFAGEAAFIAAIRPVMVENGITVRVEDIDLAYNVSGHVMVKCTYIFAHAISNTFVTVKSMGEGKDSGDKAIPKALTGAYKYALRQTFMIETGDDPDNTSSEELLAIEEKQKEASAKKRGDNLLKLLSELKTTDDLDNFKVVYETDINAFKFGNKIEKEFYTKIIGEGARLRKEFEKMELNTNKE